MTKSNDNKGQTITYGQVADALVKAQNLEEEAQGWLSIAKVSAGGKAFDHRSEQYREAAQRAIVARLEWLDIRNRFESGE